MLAQTVFRSVVMLGVVLSGLVFPCAAQTTDGAGDDTRDIVFRYGAGRRPKTAKPPAKPANPPAKPLRYERKTPRPASQPVTPKRVPKAPAPAPTPQLIAQLGVTTWVLRPSREQDDQETRVLAQVEQEQEAMTVQAFTPERVNAGHLFRAGDRVRLSLETPQAGYLYIVDRELYADGKMGEPFLIFPTLRTREGNNLVRGGHLLDIPALHEPPFILKPGRPDQVGEVLTMILSERPLETPPLQRDAELPLPGETWAGWLKWETPLEQFELAGGAGQAWTREEKNAAETDRWLEQEAPWPQTTFRGTPPAGQPLLVQVVLRYQPAKL